MDYQTILKYQISWKSIQLEPSWSIAGGRSDKNDESKSRFQQFRESTQ